MQIIEKTDEERMAVYLKLDKEYLIKMLIHCNRIIENTSITESYFYPVQLFWQIQLNTNHCLPTTTITN